MRIPHRFHLLFLSGNLIFTFLLFDLPLFPSLRLTLGCPVYRGALRAKGVPPGDFRTASDSAGRDGMVRSPFRRRIQVIFRDFRFQSIIKTLSVV